MILSILRPFRRLITKKFGGTKKFLLIFSSIVLIVYTLKTLIKGSGEKNYIQKELPQNVTGSDCSVVCDPGQLSFYLNTGSLPRKTTPIVCFQGNVIMSEGLKNIGRGLNAALIDGKTLQLKKTAVFDTYIEEIALIKFLKRGAAGSDIVLIASYDEASQAMTPFGRRYLSLFGSKLIDELKYRYNFIMVGQRGLEKGKAIEQITSKLTKATAENRFPYPPALEHAGCFTPPLGPLEEVGDLFSILQGKQIAKGNRFENCGMPEACPPEHVAVSMDTGHGGDRLPQICVDSVMVMAEDLNDAGRGFNIVILDTDLKVKGVTRVDSYEIDSADVDIALDWMKKDEIVVIVVNDDASRKLAQPTRNILNEFGSGMIQNLRFRDAWYFVGQKGTKGYSNIENLSFASYEGNWPKPLVGRYCVPKKIPTSMTIIDPLVSRNEKRRDFCTKYDGYTDFCNPSYVDDELKPVRIVNKELTNHTIYKTPVFLVPGMNHNAFINTLQTTIMQAGIQVDRVWVMWDEKLIEQGKLADIFGFKNHSLTSSLTYTEQMIKALRAALNIYPGEKYFIIIEEDLLLGPDFLPFMASALDLVMKDSTLAGAAAWNINGFMNVSGDPNAVYRVEDFPGLAFLIKTDVLQQLVDNLDRCCKQRAWSGWHLNIHGLEMLIPDVSRVYRTPFYGASALTQLSRDLFLKPRSTFLDVRTNQQNLHHLISAEYETYLQTQINLSTTVYPIEIIKCIKGIAPPPIINSEKVRQVSVFYEQIDKEDKQLLFLLCRCFGLVVMEETKPKNLHNGLLRFFFQNHDIFLIGSKTPYYIRRNSKELIKKYLVS